MDLSYFTEDVEVLVSESVYNEEGELVSPASYETQTQEKQRPRNKSYDDVLRVINKHKGKNDKALDVFIDSYLDGIQWDWYDEYLAYEKELAEVQEYNATVAGSVSHTETVKVVTGEGEDTVVSYEEVEVLYEPKPVPEAPVRPPLITVEQWRVNNYALLRRAAYPEYREQFDMQFDDKRNGTSLWQDVIDNIKLKYPKGGV